MATTSLRDEPLVRFALLGALLFAADRALAARSAEPDELAHRIEISPAFVEGLAARHAARAGDAAARPTDEALVREHVREEVLYREARARGLDEGDLIVRRRLVQAMELVLAAEVDVPEPNDDELAAFLDAHAGDFVEPTRTTVEHVYFARDRGDAARADASSALERLRAGGSADAMGDAFLSGRRIGPATDARIDATFGEGLAAQLETLEVGTWAGPLEGALGLHLVRVVERSESRPPVLHEVRAELRAAWQETERARLASQALDALTAGYDIVRTPEAE